MKLWRDGDGVERSKKGCKREMKQDEKRRDGGREKGNDDRKREADMVRHYSSDGMKNTQREMLLSEHL